MARKPNLLGLNEEVIPWIKDYYEDTMADVNIVAGISGREAIFNAAVRQLGYHKVVGEDDFTSDGYTMLINGKERRFAEKQPDLEGRRLHVDLVQRDNYLLNMGLEQIIGFITKWKVQEDLIKFFADKGLSHETTRYFENNRTLDVTVNAIPEGIPIFSHEPVVSVQGSFEKVQFPETLILGTWGYQTAVATTASYVLNILEEFGFKKTEIATLEGGSRRVYPGAALAATRAVLGAGFLGTSLEAIAREYPQLLNRVGGSTGHSSIIHIGSDEKAFELQLRAYYRINEGDSKAAIREKIRYTKGVGPVFLIDTFDSNNGLDAAIRVMKKYGIQCQVRNDSDISEERVKYIRATFDNEQLGNARIMISDDLKPWKVYNLLKKGAKFNALLMGTYLVNPYKLPGAVYKIAADQRDPTQSQMEYICKICTDNPEKGTLPGALDIYRIIGRDGKADRDVRLLRRVDSIDEFMQPTDEGRIKLNTQVITRGEITYDIPDICTFTENTAYHLGLLREEHKRFRDAVPYPVITSPTIEKIKREYERRFRDGKL